MNSEQVLASTMLPFYEYIINHSNEQLYILYPSNMEIEDYWFALDSYLLIYKEHSIINQDLKLVTINQIDEIPEGANVICDPRYFSEMLRINKQAAKEIQRLLCKIQ